MNDLTQTISYRRIEPTAFTPSSPVEDSAGLNIKPLYLAIVVLLAIALSIVWFLLSARSLIVKPTPVDAQISISGGFNFRIGGNYLMLPGDYSIKATHPEFEPLTESFSVTDENVQTLNPQMQPLPGQLLITTQPVSTFESYIDGELRSSEQNIISDISAGSHSYTITTERFQDVSGSIEIEGRTKQQSLTVELIPAWAEISLASQPPGADIKLDDQILAQTPATVELLAGDRELVIVKDGYKAKTYPLTVVAQNPQDLGELTLEKIDGLLTITSSPAAAGVTVNGQYLGQTPLEAPVTPASEITVSLFKEGYQAASKIISIGSGEARALNLDLQALLGQVSIKATPEDALLYLDGRLSGKANQTIQLPAKQHQVTITREGYAPFKTTLLPRPGLTLSLAPQLNTLEQARWASIKPVIETRVTSQTLKLFRPDVSFQMGSSRREQGRRANEARRKIALKRAFYLAPHETTNKQFRRFKSSHSSSHVSGNSLDSDNHPVVNVTWQEAALFCNWLSEQENLALFYRTENGKVVGVNPEAIGYRLPTEAEWAWVSRYQNGAMLKYSWGPTLPPTAGSENIGDRSAAALLGTIQADYDDSYAVTAPVGKMKPNHNGLYDINGNVSEWISDFYIIKTGINLETEVDPLGPLQGDYHVIRGASWANGGLSDLRLSFRDYGVNGKNNIGFRIARYVE